MLKQHLLLLTTLLVSLVATSSFAIDANIRPVEKSLNKMKSDFNQRADEAKKSDYERGIVEVAASGVLEQAINVGDKAPNFTLPSATGEEVELYDLLEDGPVVLVWYRGGWCPYCNLYLHSLQQELAKFREYDAQLVAISPEVPDKSLTTKQKSDIEFHVLSDVHNKTGDAYGVVFELPDYIAERYGDFFSFEAYYDNDTKRLPLSASYVIDKDGTVIYAFLDADYRKRGEPADMLKALKEHSRP